MDRESNVNRTGSKQSAVSPVIAMIQAHDKIHPAAAWAAGQTFSATEIDCTTTVVLNILDGKCKMQPGEKAAIMKIYDVVNAGDGELFGPDDLQAINMARNRSADEIMQRIDALRVYAESKIPKPVMKQYKARLRDALFG